MQTLEAIVSFLFLIAIISTISLEPSQMHTELQQFAIADDIWKTLEVRGDFRDFPSNSLQKDLEEVTSLTDLCVGFIEEDLASCRDNEENAIFIEKTIVTKGKLKRITFFVSRKD